MGWELVEKEIGWEMGSVWKGRGKKYGGGHAASREVATKGRNDGIVWIGVGRGGKKSGEQRKRVGTMALFVKEKYRSWK